MVRISNSDLSSTISDIKKAAATAAAQSAVKDAVNVALKCAKEKKADEEIAASSERIAASPDLTSSVSNSGFECSDSKSSDAESDQASSQKQKSLPPKKKTAPAPKKFKENEALEKPEKVSAKNNISVPAKKKKVQPAVLDDEALSRKLQAEQFSFRKATVERGKTAPAPKKIKENEALEKPGKVSAKNNISVPAKKKKVQPDLDDEAFARKLQTEEFSFKRATVERGFCNTSKTEATKQQNKDCIDYANKLIELCDLLLPKISSLHEVNCCFFVALFERVTGHAVPDLFLKDDISTDTRLMQAIINTLSQDVGLSLSHITGEDIVSGDCISILNLLEILEALFLQVSQLQNEKNFESAEETLVSTTFSQTSDKSQVKKSKIIKESTSSRLSSTVSEENAFLPRVLKHETSRVSHQSYPVSRIHSQSDFPYISKTLPKSRAIEKKMPAAMIRSPHSKRSSVIANSVKSPIKKNSTSMSGTVKQPYTEDLGELYKSNFEMKVQQLLQSDISPFLRAEQLKKKYLRSLNKPLKRKSIAPCKKSFLLPHDLRPKSKPPVKQSHSQRGICNENVVKPSFSRDIKNTKKDKEVPVAIQSVLKNFPGFQFPDNTSDSLMKHYYQHLGVIHKQLKDILLKKPLISTQTEAARKKEERRSKILEKDLQSSNRMRVKQEHKALENRVKSSLKDARCQSVRIGQYFDEFHKSMSQKMQKRNFSEEVKIEKVFKEILELQKKKVRLVCDKIKEADEDDAKQHRIYLSSWKNLYEQQLSSLSDKVKAEQEDSSLRNKEQKLVVEKSNQELYKSLKRELRSLQKDVLDMLDDIHFREVDAGN